MDKHYACACGCGGMSDHAKVCETEGCDCKGQEMKECSCADGQHAEVVAKDDNGEKTDEMPEEKA